MENEKYLFVVSGAAGTGKDSVVSALRKAHPEIEKTVSATTRSPRPGEQEGVDYYYRTKEQFQQLIDQDEVVEHNFFNGNYYGTLKEEVNKRLNAGKLVVMVIDVHGAANIRRMYPGATTIFLLPPSTQELERRLRAANAMDFDDLLVRTLELLRTRPEVLDSTRSASATLASTSIRTPTTSSTRSPTCWPPSTKTSWSWATTTSPFTAGVAPTSPTSWTLSRTLKTARPSSWSRTIALRVIS